MSQKPRRRVTPTTTDLTEPTPAPLPTPGPESIPSPPPAFAPAPPSYPDRLSVLTDYTDGDGLLSVFVAVSHDAVFVGQRLRVPVTERVAGLIEVGFLEVDRAVRGE